MLEFSLLELNAMSYGMYLAVQQAKADAKEHGGWFNDNLVVTQNAYSKVQDALFAKIKEVDDMEDKIREQKQMKAKGLISTEELDRLRDAEVRAFSKWG